MINLILYWRLVSDVSEGLPLIRVFDLPMRSFGDLPVGIRKSGGNLPAGIRCHWKWRGAAYALRHQKNNM
ncbi:MAG: hypothetical protein Metus_1303 [Candidatus Methanosuratincola subterraneus]|uniref:Uncharacterized protein n=1 Tax=Methanosuratincola subterraneus TaxID=2593994 RepID=A0A3S3VC73_METS7|nr:MAG: hypothetical protein Metus_1303 [Candidatus Methanosuratincola subterraneus]